MQNEQSTTGGMIRSLAGSVLFLTGAIGYSVYVVFELLTGFTGGTSLLGLWEDIMLKSGSYSMMDYGTLDVFYNVMTGMSVITTLITLLPAMVITAGIWMIFAAAKKNVLPGTAATGLTMIRIIAIIRLVFAALGLALMELAMILGMVVAGSVGTDGYVTLIFIVAMLVIAAVSAVGILFYLKLSGTVSRMRQTLVTGMPDRKISLYVEIYCYLAGGLSAIMALVSLTSMSVWGMLANAGMATADIAFAMLLRKYRAQMEWILQNPQPYQEQPYQQPYQEQPYQEQPYQQPYQEQLYQQPYQEQPSPYQRSMPYPYPEESPSNETEVLPYYNETSVLSGQMISDGMTMIVRLIRERTKETICVNKTSFWVGKDAAHVDYCITDNTAVSRRHALFTIRDNMCFVRDNYSTNGVFVNGHMLKADVDVPVSDGDRVRMGDEEFTVRIG